MVSDFAQGTTGIVPNALRESDQLAGATLGADPPRVSVCPYALQEHWTEALSDLVELVIERFCSQAVR